MSRPKSIVTDIESTTTPIAFVRSVLFPYARDRLADFVRTRGAEPAIRELLAAAKREAGDPAMDDATAVGALRRWIDEDRKATPLKSLQGLIWQAGYADGSLRAPVFLDAARCLRAWHAEGIGLFVYSSGSVDAQKLLFAHADAGDLTTLFSGYFDTRSGAKGDPQSYRRIADAIGERPADILFLSDVPAELDAAAAAGLGVCQLVRPGEGATPGRHPVAATFDQVARGWAAVA